MHAALSSRAARAAARPLARSLASTSASASAAAPTPYDTPARVEASPWTRFLQTADRLSYGAGGCLRCARAERAGGLEGALLSAAAALPPPPPPPLTPLSPQATSWRTCSAAFS